VTARSLTVVAVVLASVLGACGSASRTPESSRPFHSDEYGYALQLPDGWTAITATRYLDDGEPPGTGNAAVDIFAARPNTRVSVMSSPALVIGAQRVPLSTTLASWEQRVVKIVDFMKGCPAPDHRESIRVDGVAASLLVYDDCPKELDYFHLWVAVEKNGIGYHVVLFDHQGHQASDRATLFHALRSLRFSR
jgi:hypothetical protein